MRYRRPVLIFLFMVFLFVGANYLVWTCWTEVLLTNTRYQGGDLARMGYIYGAKDLRTNSNDLPRHHIAMKEYDGGSVDMLTVGDSFSNGGGCGRNRFYQDYIASINGMKVLNIPRHRDLCPVESISLLCNNGFLDRVRPRYVLISIAENGALDLAAAVDFSRSMSPEQLKQYKEFDFYTPFPNPSFINDGNIKFLLNNVLYNVSDRALFGRVYMRRLSIDFFTVPYANRLLFLRNKRLPTPDAVTRVNDNLNKLADMLSRKGIKLVFMPCVDKFTLYSKYLVDCPYPCSSFFELLRPLPKRYQFVDTKAILAEELRRGEKDVFYADDTHWSWKAAKAIFEQVRFTP